MARDTIEIQIPTSIDIEVYKRALRAAAHTYVTGCGEDPESLYRAARALVAAEIIATNMEEE